MSADVEHKKVKHKLCRRHRRFSSISRLPNQAQIEENEKFGRKAEKREKINKKLRQKKAGCIVQKYEREREVMQKYEPLFMYGSFI